MRSSRLAGRLEPAGSISHGVINNNNNNNNNSNKLLSLLLLLLLLLVSLLLLLLLLFVLSLLSTALAQRQTRCLTGSGTVFVPRKCRSMPTHYREEFG